MQDRRYPGDLGESGDPRKLIKTRHPGIYKRGGRYVVIARIRGKQTKRFAESLAHALDVQADLRKTRHKRPSSRVTFAQYAPTWIGGYLGRTSRGIREATKADYARQLGLDQNGEPTGDGAVEFFGSMRLVEIEPRDVKGFASHVRERGVAENTVRLALAPVKALLADAFEEGLIPTNPAARLRLVQPQANPDESQKGQKALTEDELRALLANVSSRWRLYAEVLAHAGLRPSEALALRWRDIDFGRRRVEIRRSVVRRKFGQPKTTHSRRDVPLSPAMTQALWHARKQASDGRDDALVFASDSGGPLRRDVVYRAVKAAAKRAGVPWATQKTLRHTCGSILFERGWNILQVSRFLGHHSPAFTLKVYVHLLRDDLPEPTFLDSIVEPVGDQRNEEARRADAVTG